MSAEPLGVFQLAMMPALHDRREESLCSSLLTIFEKDELGPPTPKTLSPAVWEGVLEWASQPLKVAPLLSHLFPCRPNQTMVIHFLSL